MTKRFQKVNAEQIGLIPGEDFVSEFPVIDPNELVADLDRECPECHYRWAGVDVRTAAVEALFEEFSEEILATATFEPPDETTCPRCRKAFTMEQVYRPEPSSFSKMACFRVWP